VCDVPALSFIKYTKGHTGYSSCSHCDIEGEFISNRICYPGKLGSLRNDASFRAKTDIDHHNGTSYLELLSINMVENFPHDYMHLICLGVTRRLISFWMKGSLFKKYKLSSSQIVEISRRLVSLRGYVPREFARKPRGLHEMDRWKATELRQFLLYTGPFVLHHVLHDDLYNHFMTLHVAIRILCTHSLCKHKQLFEYAKNLLSHFVACFEILYGKQSVSYNVHGLLHLHKDCSKFGNLDEFSAFPFEII